MRPLLILFLSSFTFSAFGQSDTESLRAFAFYTKKGKAITFKETINTLDNSDVILFGELHNNAVLHWLQYRMIKALSTRQKPLVLGGEFFERDDQYKIDEYLAGWIDDKQFEKAARLWSNYETDYKPILNFAKDSSLSFIATNVPRRYAAITSRHSLDTLKYLPDASKKYLPELPIEYSLETPGYEAMLQMMQAHGGKLAAEKMVQAQALKDATMARTIAENHSAGELFFHINGDYHSADYGGIYWYLKRMDKKLKISTIKVFSADDLTFNPKWKNTGDLILVVPEDFTKTY